MEPQGRHLIGAEPSREGAASFRSCDPTTGQPFGPEYAEATPAEIDRALSLARAAGRDLADAGRARRAAFLERLAGELESLGDPLLELCSAETALPRGRLVGERARTVAQARLFAELAREGSWLEARRDPEMPDREPLPRPELRRVQVPLGPVAVFAASNFPLAFSVAGADTVAALAAGCPAVVKAHPLHPQTSELVGRAVARALAECGLPAGAFSLLHGATPEVGAALVRHPLTRAVAFTGSLAGGRALFDLAAARPEPIPVYAEMGSVNPLFLLPGALAARAGEIAAGLHASLTLGVGQFCTNPGLVVLERGGSGDFVRALAELVEETPAGTMLSAGIRAGYGAGVERLQDDPAVELRAAGRPAGDGPCEARAHLFTTRGAAFLERAHLADEVFGPSTLAVLCEDRAELLAVAEALPGQLSAGLHAEPDELEGARELARILAEKAGRVLFGGFPTGVEVCPAMHHGGPYPATTDPRSTSVGTASIRRFTRPVCYQGFPPELLPDDLRDPLPERSGLL